MAAILVAEDAAPGDSIGVAPFELGAPVSVAGAAGSGQGVPSIGDFLRGMGLSSNGGAAVEQQQGPGDDAPGPSRDAGGRFTSGSARSRTKSGRARSSASSSSSNADQDSADWVARLVRAVSGVAVSIWGMDAAANDLEAELIAESIRNGDFPKPAIERAQRLVAPAELIIGLGLWVSRVYKVAKYQAAQRAAVVEQKTERENRFTAWYGRKKAEAEAARRAQEWAASAGMQQQIAPDKIEPGAGDDQNVIYGTWQQPTTGANGTVKRMGDAADMLGEFRIGH